MNAGDDVAYGVYAENGAAVIENGAVVNSIGTAGNYGMVGVSGAYNDALGDRSAFRIFATKRKRDGVDNVVIDNRDHDLIARTHRAGILEAGSVRMLLYRLHDLLCPDGFAHILQSHVDRPRAV